jgi:hypothetical protein
MTVGMALMLAQAISLLFKDFARVLGRNTVHFGPAKS